MAQNRSFKFMGQGYGNSSSPPSISVSIAGNEIFSGTVPYIDEPINPVPPLDPASAVTLAVYLNSPIINTDFQGTQPMSVTVTGGYGVSFGSIDANWYLGNVSKGGGTVDNFFICTQNTANVVNYGDPRANVVIDGVPQTVDRTIYPGCYTWTIPSGSAMTYDLVVVQGWDGSGPYVPPVPPPADAPPV